MISETGETKRIFRAAMRGIVPHAILDRRDKIGLVTREREWVMRLAPTIREWFGPGFDIPFVKRNELAAACNAVVDRKVPFSWQAWRWANYIRWYGVLEFQDE